MNVKLSKLDSNFHNAIQLGDLRFNLKIYYITSHILKNIHTHMRSTRIRMHMERTMVKLKEKKITSNWDECMCKNYDFFFYEQNWNKPLN